MGKGIFNWQQWYCGAIDVHHEQTISSEEMHTLVTFMVSVMTSNTVGMAYKLIYNPLTDYIRSHVRLCAVL